MSYPEAAWERAMTVQEVMLKALSGELHWFRAAEILGWSPRTLRRWRERFETHGHSGLIDRRLLRPSKRRVPPAQVELVLRLYRERYAGFNVRHFHQIARREHGVTVSYSFVKQTLQAAGLVKKHRARGRHRRRREPRACFGEMLHLDGSVHAWFTLAPDGAAVPDRGVRRCDQARARTRRSIPSESTLGGDDESGGRPPHARACRWRSTPTGRTGPFTRRRRRGPSTRRALTQVGRALGAAWASSTSRRIRRKRAAGVSGSIARFRIAWSTSCAWRGSRRSPAANRYLAEHVRPAAQRHVRARAARSGECLRAARRRRSRRHPVSRRGRAWSRATTPSRSAGAVLQIARAAGPPQLCRA